MKPSTPAGALLLSARPLCVYSKPWPRESGAFSLARRRYQQPLADRLLHFHHGDDRREAPVRKNPLDSHGFFRSITAQICGTSITKPCKRGSPVRAAGLSKISTAALGR